MDGRAGPAAAEAADYASETTSKSQFPKSSTPANYDTAWGFQGGARDITYSNRVILVKDVSGQLQDAVPFKSTSASPPGTFPGQLQPIQAAGQWLPANCGGAPAHQHNAYRRGHFGELDGPPGQGHA